MEINYKIDSIKAREIFDSRGNPTIETKITSNNIKVTSSVPSGASTGSLEATELRDNNNTFNGLGVSKAVSNVNNIIAKKLIGKNPKKQREIDQIMIDLDGTSNKSKLGANAILSVSQAVARLSAKIEKKELYEYLHTLYDVKNPKKMPLLYVNLINGGKHTESKLAFQEYLVVFNFNKGKVFDDIFKFQNELKKELPNGIGDEGGFIINTENIEEPLKILNKIITKLNFKDKVTLALDIAASSFCQNNKYILQGKELEISELLEVYKKIAKTYPISSIEDPFEETDFNSFTEINKVLKDILIVGDDITVTNKKLLQKAIEGESIDSIIIKPNQIGTLTEVFETINFAQENNINCIVSHRSGETNDDFIADLSVAIGAYGIKLGAMQRGERIAKYNRLKQIYEKGI